MHYFQNIHRLLGALIPLIGALFMDPAGGRKAKTPICPPLEKNLADAYSGIFVVSVISLQDL